MFSLPCRNRCLALALMQNRYQSFVHILKQGTNQLEQVGINWNELKQSRKSQNRNDQDRTSNELAKKKQEIHRMLLCVKNHCPVE